MPLFLYTFAASFLTAWYLFFGLSPGIVLFVGAATAVVGLFRFRRWIGSHRLAFLPAPLSAKILSLVILAGDGMLLWAFVQARTDVALTSPWLVLSPWIFFLYGTTSFALLLLSRERARAWFIAAASLHVFVACSVATMIYAVGFGFDPFLHRAAEKALFEHGVIEPKTPLYAGQYVVVTALSWLTRLSVATIDKWLVPVLAALTLPAVATYGLEKGWKLSLIDAQTGAAMLLLFPFMALTFTVPYNLTVVYLLWVLFLWPLAQKTKNMVAVLGGIAVLSLLTHPLLGLPIATIVLMAVCRRMLARWPRVRFVAMAVGILALAVGLPLLMSVYSASQGVPLAATNPFDRIDYFFGLFSDPFQVGPRFWEMLYWFRFAVPVGIAFSAFVWAMFARKSPSGVMARLHVAFTIGLLGAIFLLSTLFVYKDVIVFEQSEYALRLVQALFLIAIPVVACAWAHIVGAIRHPFWSRALLLPVALLMTTSLYFSYPQSNPKVLLSGPGVSGADVAAVHAADQLAEGEPYIVLSNQMTSAAALQEFGFRDYVHSDAGPVLWYAIPTGGPLYGFYSDMTYGRPERFIAEGAAHFTGTKRVYFLAYRYWPGFEWIAAYAQAGADAWYSVDDGAIILFEYRF